MVSGKGVIKKKQRCDYQVKIMILKQEHKDHKTYNLTCIKTIMVANCVKG